jgi:hypothetical protein
MLIFCAIATPCPRAPTSCNPFVRRFNVACTPTQPHSCWASHNLQSGMTGTRSGTRATPTAHPSSNVRCTSTSRANAIAAGSPPRSRPTASPFCQHCCQHAATAWPCPPCRTSPCCSLLCRGRAPLLHYIQDAAKSQGSPGPPGRSRLHCVCVCVGCVMLLCRSMRLLLSGWMSLAMRLPRRCFGRCFAYVLGFGFGCSCGLLLAQPPSYARCCVRSTRAGLGGVSDTIGSAIGCYSVAFTFGCAGRCSLQSHHTPHTTRSLTTQHPHTSYTTHHAYHTNTSHHPSLILAYTQVWDGMPLVVYLGCTPVLDQVQQIYPIFPS